MVSSQISVEYILSEVTSPLFESQFNWGGNTWEGQKENSKEVYKLSYPILISGLSMLVIPTETSFVLWIFDSFQKTKGNERCMFCFPLVTIFLYLIWYSPVESSVCNVTRSNVLSNWIDVSVYHFCIKTPPTPSKICKPQKYIYSQVDASNITRNVDFSFFCIKFWATNWSSCIREAFWSYYIDIWRLSIGTFEMTLISIFASWSRYTKALKDTDLPIPKVLAGYLAPTKLR